MTFTTLNSRLRQIIPVPCFILFIFALSAIYPSAAVNNDAEFGERWNKFIIAFGSCAQQHKPQPVLENVAKMKPDLFIYLGDNVNSTRFYPLDECYQTLAKKKEYLTLKKSTSILATWDDHDYGANDAGNDNPDKEKSKKLFLNFFGVIDKSILEHKGIYYSKFYYTGARIVQVIMLDLRTFRDPIPPYDGSKDGDEDFNYKMNYIPHKTPGPTLLGNEQWTWLEKQLSKKADIRIIASSTQFAITYNGYEAWANFPHEQRRMLNLIRKTRAEGVIFISGDVHYAEISRLTPEKLYPIHEITSSGITSTWDFATLNDNRIDGPVMENNHGLLEINIKDTDPEIHMKIFDVEGKLRISRRIKLSKLKFR